LVNEPLTKEEILRQKEKVDALSAEAKESYKFLMRICNGISLAENLDVDGNKLSKIDNLVYILKDNLVDHLTSLSSLVSAYEEYSEMLERSNPQIKNIEGKRQPYK
jgi:hypothetical protein